MERISVYSSANDQALHVSSRVHGGLPQLGHFSAPVMLSESRHVPLADNVDVIDATGFDKSVVGHTYVLTHAGIIEDVCAALQGAAAASRCALRLERPEDGGFRYWRFVGSKEQQATEEEENMQAQVDEGMCGEDIS